MCLISRLYHGVNRVFRSALTDERRACRKRPHAARSRRLSIEGLEGRAMLAAGDHDTSFAGDGRWTAKAGDDETSVRAIIPRTDGKLWVCGPSYLSSTYGSILLMRLNADGSYDRTFDSNGQARILEFNPSSFTYSVVDMKLLSTGKILIAGTYDRTTGTNDIFFARLNANGSIDKTFGGTGVVRKSWGGDDVLSEISAKSDGKIVVIGTSDYKGTDDMVVARYNADGSPDTTFNGSGRIHIDFPTGQKDYGISLRHVSGGKIVAVGGTRTVAGQGDFAIARLNSNGKLDTTFRGDGKQVWHLGGNEAVTDFTLDSSGRLLICGYQYISATESKAVAGRFNADGSVDTTFANNGRFLITQEYGVETFSDIAVQADGKILLVGVSDTLRTKAFSVTRILRSGKLD
jgi:uncharacterized delta-60 repeat protein